MQKLKGKSQSCVLILHNVRSVHNVGAIFRTADAAGVVKIYLTGYTPAPLDRFGRARADLHKSALGAELTVPWEQREDVEQLIQDLRFTIHEIEIIGLEQDKRAIDYKSYRPRKDFALIVGNEVGGIPKEILDLCDKIIEISMRGKKESLNVSVALGVALFQITGI